MSTEEKSSDNPFERNPNSLQATPWIAYAAEQAQLFQKTAEQTLDSSIARAKTRLSEIRSTSSAHFNQTLDSLQDFKEDYKAYENVFFGKLKESVLIAAANPTITCGATLGLGVLLLKRPRRFLTRNASRIFVSEETMLSRAEAKVKDLQNSINSLKSESEKLEKQAVQAEEELRRGKTKLKHAGNQIQSVIRKAHKIERDARGLKDIVGELPSREASRFRSQVSTLASEAKRERNELTKQVSKIINYGIPI